MRHRQLSSRSQFFEIDQHESQCHRAAGTPYDHMGRTVAPENASFLQSIPVRTNGPSITSGRQLQSSTNLGLEGAPVFAPGSGPSSYNSLSHFPAGGNFFPLSEPNMVQSQSCLYNRHVPHATWGGLVNMMGSGRGALKRKYPDFSLSCDRVSTSGSHDAGSSSNSFEFRVEEPTSDYSNSIAGEDSQRNVRNRTRIDIEANATRVYSSHPYYSSYHQQNHPRSTTFSNSNIDFTRYGNPSEVSAATPRRFQTSANSSSTNGMNTCFVGGHSADINGRYLNESMFGRNPAPHPLYLHNAWPIHDVPHIHVSRENPSNYSRGDSASYRTGLHSSHLVQQTPSFDGGPWYSSANYHCRYPMPFSARGWRHNHRRGRSRITTGRFNPLRSVAHPRHRIQNEAVSVLNRPYRHASGNLFDQYQNMRLDIDNMGYEELLALGERIGNVNTGLSEDVISECLMESAYTQSDEDTSSCPICLEEYEKTEKVGKVKKCGHEYHVECIRKWLGMKNACPMCKAPAFAHS